MEKTIQKKITIEYLVTDVPVMLAAAVLLAMAKPLQGYIMMGLAIAAAAYHIVITSRSVEKNILNFSAAHNRQENAAAEAFCDSCPLPSCITDRNQKIVWGNKAFKEFFSDAELFNNILNEDIGSKISSGENGPFCSFVSGRHYEINCADTDVQGYGSKMIFIRDISREKQAEKKYMDSFISIAFISIDNLDAVLQDTPIEERSALSVKIEQTINNWAKGIEASIYKVDSDCFIMILSQREVKKLIKTDFSVLDDARKIETKSNLPVSVSIGIGNGEGSLSEIQQRAMESLELAKGRGGDQAVIKNDKHEVKFFGGTMPSVENRNLAHTKVMTHGLLGIIRESSNIFIMGHRNPDMDSYGAALGIYSLVYNMGKPCSIVTEGPKEGNEALFQYISSYTGKGHIDISYIKPADAVAVVGNSDLLIIVDHHRASLSESEELINRMHKLVIIDHHRQAQDIVENAALSFMNPSASSASEIVSEILRFSGAEGQINKAVADALLCGITLDTKNFTMGTGLRTFEAASWLKSKDADANSIKNYFKLDFGDFKKKMNILYNAQIFDTGIAVSYTKDQYEGINILVSQAADELLRMKGVRASIVAGSDGSTTYVSARSNGDINVQVLMEELHGGGHRTIAATQLETGPEESINLIVQLLREKEMI